MICPYCNKEVTIEAVYCPYCGEEINNIYNHGNDEENKKAYLKAINRFFIRVYIIFGVLCAILIGGMVALRLTVGGFIPIVTIIPVLLFSIILIIVFMVKHIKIVHNYS